MGFISVSAKNRFGFVNWMLHAINGKHCKLKSVDTKKISECIIKPMSDSYFNIDGEIFPNDEAHVKIMPKFIRLMGKLHDMNKYHKTLTEEIERETS